MAAEVNKEIELEIAYVLFIDIVGYSKLLFVEQRRLLEDTQRNRYAALSTSAKRKQYSRLDDDADG